MLDATTSIGVGVEAPLSHRWTLDVSGSYNGWTFSHGRRWKHLLLQPEARYWLCDNTGGHFVGFHLHGGQYNLGHLGNNLRLPGSNLARLGDYRYQGWFAGGGAAYGYAWILGRHWNLEGEIGLGYAYSQYDKFECAGCGRKVERSRSHHYVGPTKLALNLVYIF